MSKHIGFLVGPGFEDLEFWVPYMRLIEERMRITVIGVEARATYASKHGCLHARAEAAARLVDAAQLDALVIPGGWSQDEIRRDKDVCRIVRDAYDADKPGAMICHAGLVGISTGIVKGHRATGSEGVRDDLVNAGATWADEPAFRDEDLIWGRFVEDTPDFCRELVAALGDDS